MSDFTFTPPPRSNDLGIELTERTRGTLFERPAEDNPIFKD